MPLPRQFLFGDFCLDAEQRALFRQGQLVALTPKSLETLLFLVERHGRIVDKQELLDAVWPGTFVEEGSLARNVSVLRKTLSGQDDGQSFIETIPKRGYRFVAPVTLNGSDSSKVPPASSVITDEPAVASGTPVSAHRAETKKLSAIRRWLAWATIALGVAVLLAYWLLAGRPALSFASRDWILIGDFENQTGDPRFDKALLTALTVSLEQSRYANIFPRSRVPETLQRMGKSRAPGQDLAIDENLGREICQRENLRALFEAGLTRTGKEYFLTGRLIDPKTGVAVRS